MESNKHTLGTDFINIINSTPDKINRKSTQLLWLYLLKMADDAKLSKWLNSVRYSLPANFDIEDIKYAISEDGIIDYDNIKVIFLKGEKNADTESFSYNAISLFGAVMNMDTNNYLCFVLRSFFDLNSDI